MQNLGLMNCVEDSDTAYAVVKVAVIWWGPGG
jgi:hypothetical protein